MNISERMRRKKALLNKHAEMLIMIQK